MNWAIFLEEVMQDMSHTWQDLVSEVVSMLWYGWSYFEIILKLRSGQTGPFDDGVSSKFDDGRIGFRKISIRAQETLDGWEFDAEGGIKGMWQSAAPDYNRVFIPIEKAILFRTETTKNNPLGRSLLRNAYRSWSFLKRLEEIEGIGMERDLVGIPIVKMPMSHLSTNATPAQKALVNQFFELIQQIRRNEHEGIVFPSDVDEEGNKTGFDISLLSTGGERQLDISGSIRRHQLDIATTLLTQFSFLGTDKTGSFALSSDQTNNFAFSIGSILDNVEETFHRFGVSRLMRFNGAPQEMIPRWKHGDLEKDDLVRFADSLSKLSAAGIVSVDQNLEDFARERLGLPKRSDEMGITIQTGEEEAAAPTGEQDGTGESQDADL
jgi:hypothetical protein